MTAQAQHADLAAAPPQRAAVLGSPIKHSLSPVLHNAGYAAAGLAGWEYGRIECAESELARIVGEASAQYRGFSVTMPAKFAALRFADEVSERARFIGSANTLVRTRDPVSYTHLTLPTILLV